jgi:hypothetical protein
VYSLCGNLERNPRLERGSRETLRQTDKPR